MKRFLGLVALCVAVGCVASDSASPAPDDNSTSQVGTVVDPVGDPTIEVDETALATKTVSFEVPGMS